MNRIKDAAAILQQLPRESALLQLPLFVSLLCDKGQISAIAEIDFGVYCHSFLLYRIYNLTFSDNY